MALGPSDTARFARKIGYGLRPGEDPADIVEWALAQLSAVPPPVGIARRAGPKIVPWPEDQIWDLEKLVINILAYRAGMDVLDRKLENNSTEYGIGRYKLQTEHSAVRFDILRHCHQPLYSAAPVFERFANFWRNHFTVGDGNKANDLAEHMVDHAIKANMLKTFADMLFAVTSHPAMVSYLDNIYSIGPNSSEGRGKKAGGFQSNINENLARELLELHTVSPVAGYAQEDVTETAKVLTGWGYVYELPSEQPKRDKSQAFFPQRHEPGEKVVLGQKIPAGEAGLRTLTDFLAAKTETIDHVSKKLARHFIREEPTDADVAAIADAWKTGGGDLQTIHRAVVERAASELDARKFQQPEAWLFQMARTSGANPFLGFDEVDEKKMDPYERDAETMLRELGQFDWASRQPDGFSDAKADWVSPEHMERRVRFSDLIGRGGALLLAAPAIADRAAAGPSTRTLMATETSLSAQFILLWCSPEFTEA